MNFVKFSILTLVLISFLGCGGDDPAGPGTTTVPVLTTSSVSGITQATAQSGGSITSDGGEAVTTRGICWSTNQTPTTTDSKTSDGAGTGSFTSSITSLTASTSYYVRAYATNSVGTGYGNTQSFTATASSGTVTDIDDNVYQTVIIGTQEWMAENLKVTHYRNGDAISNIPDSTSWNNLVSGAYCEYEDAEDVVTFGRLYNFYAVEDNRNIAPAGWHVPSSSEWGTMISYLGGSYVGGKLKEAGTIHWMSPNAGATNESGFTALPGGLRGGASDRIGLFKDYNAYLWTSTEAHSTNARWRILSYNDSSLLSRSPGKEYGASVRCVKD